MSERRPHMPERLIRPEARHEAEPPRQHTPEKAAKPGRHERREDLAEIKRSIERHAVSGAELAARHVEHHRPAQHYGITRELKQNALRRGLKRIQHRLPAGARAFSTFIHQPAIDSVSNFGAKTVARPSGVLAGGVAAFVGSSAMLCLARRYGFEYNFILFIILFAAGFAVGVIVEILWRSVRRR